MKETTERHQLPSLKIISIPCLNILNLAWLSGMSCDFFAGWVGGCVGILFGHPLDTLKVVISRIVWIHCKNIGQDQIVQFISRILARCVNKRWIPQVLLGLWGKLSSRWFLDHLWCDILRIQLKLNTALLSTFRASVRPSQAWHLTFLTYIKA